MQHVVAGSQWLLFVLPTRVELVSVAVSINELEGYVRARKEST